MKNHAATPKSSQSMYFIDLSLRDCAETTKRLGRPPGEPSKSGDFGIDLDEPAEIE
jgi:hypothetical protein